MLDRVLKPLVRLPKTHCRLIYNTPKGLPTDCSDTVPPPLPFHPDTRHKESKFRGSYKVDLLSSDSSSIQGTQLGIYHDPRETSDGGDQRRRVMGRLWRGGERDTKQQDSDGGNLKGLTLVHEI